MCVVVVSAERVALCRLLLKKPNILLLDEPTNHLDAESIDWLEQFLQNYAGKFIAITHDLLFPRQCCWYGFLN